MRDTVSKPFAVALCLLMILAIALVLVQPRSSQAAAKRLEGPALSFGPFNSPAGAQFCTINWGDSMIHAALVQNGPPTAVSNNNVMDVTLTPGSPACFPINPGSMVSVALVLSDEDQLSSVSGAINYPPGPCVPTPPLVRLEHVVIAF
jgi:hypothetical protein